MAEEPGRLQSKGLQRDRHNLVVHLDNLDFLWAAVRCFSSFWPHFNPVDFLFILLILIAPPGLRTFTLTHPSVSLWNSLSLAFGLSGSSLIFCTATSSETPPWSFYLASPVPPQYCFIANVDLIYRSLVSCIVHLHPWDGRVLKNIAWHIVSTCQITNELVNVLLLSEDTVEKALFGEMYHLKIRNHFKTFLTKGSAILF